MASSNSTTDLSPKFQLPTRRSIMAEAKPPSPAREWLSTQNAALSNFQKIVAGLTGTYILVFVGRGAALTDKVQRPNMLGIAIVWGAVLMAAIYALGHVPGAHFNPAVSIALAVARKFSWKQVPMYILAQVLGSTLASLTLRLLFHDQGNIQRILNPYSDPTSDLEASAWEFIITFILMFTICGVATDPRASKDLSGVAIGGAVMFNAMIAGPITGASMNPARSLGPALVSGVYKNIWVYIVSPILGATTAAVVYSVLRAPEPGRPEIQINPHAIIFTRMLIHRPMFPLVSCKTVVTLSGQSLGHACKRQTILKARIQMNSAHWIVVVHARRERKNSEFE